MKYPLAFDSWGEEEYETVNRTVRSGNRTMGAAVRNFEYEFVKWHKRELTHEAVMVNSGSSANLLAISALFITQSWSRGDEVIVPAVGWSTTYAPLVQLGLTAVFVDVDADGVIDITNLDKFVSQRTRAVVAVNVLGRPPQLTVLRNFCDRHGLALIEDNCEGFGSYEYNLPDTNWCGFAGDVGTWSFFFSHHLNTMEGGMVVARNSGVADCVRCLRAHGWIRDLRSDRLLQTFNGNIRQPDFNDKFTFILPGYCMRPTEIQGAVGLVQLGRAKEFLVHRKANSMFFMNVINRVKTFKTISDPARIGHTWYGLPLHVEPLYEGRRNALARYLARNGIESRPVITGNFLRQPMARNFGTVIANGLNRYEGDCTLSNIDHSLQNGYFKNADDIDANAMFFGNTGHNLKNEIDYLGVMLQKFLEHEKGGV